MSYQIWRRAFLDACNADTAYTPAHNRPWSVEDFYTVNIKRLYETGFTPKDAAILCKAVHHISAALLKG
jgi:hypothetical protein